MDNTGVHCVFHSIALRLAGRRFDPEYRFIRNDKLAIAAGGWCFLITAAACLLGVYDKNTFPLSLKKNSTS